MTTPTATRTPARTPRGRNQPANPAVAGQWHRAITAFTTDLHAADRSPRTVKQYRNMVGAFAATCQAGPFHVKAGHVTGYLAAGTGLARATKYAIRGALKAFFAWAVRTGRMAATPMDHVLRIRPASVHVVSATEAHVAALVADPNPRRRLAGQLGAWHGLRLSEICTVHSDDVRPDRRGGFTLAVHGKGSKDRLVPCHPDTAAAILAARGWAFPSVIKRGQHLGPNRVSIILTAGGSAGFTPHQLRHRYATVTYYRSHDIVQVSTLMGHSSIAVTQTYIDQSTDLLHAAAATAWQ